MALEKVEPQGKQLLVNNSVLTGIILPDGGSCIGLGMRFSKRWAGGLPLSGRERRQHQTDRAGWEGAGLAD